MLASYSSDDGFEHRPAVNRVRAQRADGRSHTGIGIMSKHGHVEIDRKVLAGNAEVDGGSKRRWRGEQSECVQGVDQRHADACGRQESGQSHAS